MVLTMNRDRVPDDDRSNHLLPHVGRTIWDNGPQLLFGSVLLLFAAWPALLLATGTSWIAAWPVLMLCMGAVWAGIVAASGRLLDGDAITVRAMFELIRLNAVTGLRTSVVPAITGTILLGSARLLDRNPEASWLAIPLLLDLGVAIVVGTSLISVFTVATTSGLTGTDLWLASAGVTISRPVPVLGTVTLFGIVIGMTAAFGPTALLALAPLAVLCAAVTRDALPMSSE